MGVLFALELVALGAARNAWRVVQQPGPASLDEALVVVVLAACALIGAWLVVSTVVALAAHLPGRWGESPRRWAHAWTPAVVRRIAAVLVGAALSGTLVPGSASGDDAVPERVPGFAVTAPGFAVTAPTPGAAGPGWTPSRPVGAAAPAARLVTSGSAPRASEVVVHRGDTLGDIVRRHLGPGASDAEVAAAWPRWHAANRQVIGPDPDRLLPGQVLRAPEPSRAGDGAGAHR